MRSVGDAHPRHLLVTLLGDYWWGRAEYLPSAALVALASEFGVTPAAARAALSRLRRRDLLASSKAGRHTYYGLTQRARLVLAEGRDRIMAFGTRSEPWDGRWTVAAFSVPEEQRALRHALRTRLRWLGFAPLYDGMWVSPHDGVDQALEALRDLKVERATVMLAAIPAGNRLAGTPVTAWDLEHIRKMYEGFVEEYEPLLERVRRGGVSASEALIARTALMDIWRNFPNLDPELPDQLLPPGWPRRQARGIFAEVYDGLGPLAEVRVKQVVSRHAPELTGSVHHLTTGG